MDFPQIRAALTTIEVADLDAHRRAILLGWLDAWRHHWPSRFTRELGELGANLHAALKAQAFDANRFLKLRRIATENLAGVL